MESLSSLLLRLLMPLNGLVSVVQLVLMILAIACCIKYLRSR